MLCCSSWLLPSLLLLLAAAPMPAWSQSPDPTPAKRPTAVAEPAQSIFNEKLRRFKFQLEHEVATPETAETFMLRYNRPDNPRILGAYADAETNSLLVIGPPEAEQAIRENLASWIVESQIPAAARPLPMQLRQLQQEYTDLLRQLAETEVEQVEAAAHDSGSLDQLRARLQALEKEVRIVEQQIRVVRKYLDRKHESEP